MNPTHPMILIATWNDGLFLIGDGIRGQELAHRSVRSLAADGAGGALAIVDGHSLQRRSPRGDWSTLVTTSSDLACCVRVGDDVFVGTNDAHVLRVGEGGAIEQLRGFDAVPGRDRWYAGQALVDGRLLGPPLGVRSITATCDGAVLLANVHVGGIPRSMDGGVTWQPTIDIDSDVHEVRAHPSNPNVVAAAAAVGLCSSRDGGESWRVERDGLHASYCSAVCFSGGDVLVAAATDHFAAEAALYRRRADSPGMLTAVPCGPSERIQGIADTGCVAGHGSAVVVADRQGNVYVSMDAGKTWSHQVDGLPTPSTVLLT